MVVGGIADAFLFATYLVYRKSFFQHEDIHHVFIVSAAYYVLAYQSFIE